jgi:hypothetical protein
MAASLFIPRAEVAAQLGMSDRTLRRHLARLAAEGKLDIRPVLGTKFSDDEIARLIEALRCPCTSAVAAPSTIPGAPSVSAGRPLKSRNSAQEAIRALTRKSPRRPPSELAPELAPDGKGRPGMRQN